jgi:hypothetical protein
VSVSGFRTTTVLYTDTGGQLCITMPFIQFQISCNKVPVYNFIKTIKTKQYPLTAMEWVFLVRVGRGLKMTSGGQKQSIN